MAVTLSNSSFADLSSYLAPAGGSITNTFAYSGTINVALVLNRENDAAPLLSANWASRQQQIASLGDSIWSTYGADPAKYYQTVDAIESLGITVLDTDAYISGPETRTIWVQLEQNLVEGIDQFHALFGTTLLVGDTGLPAPNLDKTLYWNGELSLPWATDMGVRGVWFDSYDFSPVLPNPGSGTPADLPVGEQSPGNTLSNGKGRRDAEASPHDIALNFYNFPLSIPEWWQVAPTGAIGLTEPGLGAVTPPGSTTTFQDYVDTYRAGEGITAPVQVTEVANGGTNYVQSGERALDVSIATSINPNSELILYAGSGYENGARSEPLTAYQSAVWDTVNNPEVISSSDRFVVAQPSPGSPFLYAADQVFEDAALRNITLLSSSGDGGSGYETPNGRPNVSSSRGSQYNLIVGGTSVSTWKGALIDPTVRDLELLVRANDPATLWQLIASGLQGKSTNALTVFVETVWNVYKVAERKHGGYRVDLYDQNKAGTGGVDPTHGVPSYQQNFGLTPTSSDPSQIVGRGVPDVAALAGGNAKYRVMGNELVGTVPDGGTSSATPLWASLITQFNTIFADQNLPQLGYMNDLLYTAAAVAPASFQDITIGNNISTYLLGDADSDYWISRTPIIPTGFGYEAGPGYDLTTGLGTPNGVLLGRALTAIAHHQMSYSTVPDLIVSGVPDGWTSAASQTLIVQASSSSGADIDFMAGGSSIDFATPAAGTYAWTARFAQQVLQADFSANWVTKFDGATQGMVAQVAVSAGDDLSVSIDSERASAHQGTLTSPFGFADFTNADGTVRLSRPVMVAETVEATGNTAIVRLRDNGRADLSLMFYKVDDFNGTVAGIAPGEAGYAQAAADNAYQLGNGSTTVNSPRHGQYKELQMLDVAAGDLIAMQLVNNSAGRTFYGFSQANDPVRKGPVVNHLINYGLNTFGWEESAQGGDRDYNDLVVQVDFTSAYGSGYLK